MAVLTTLELNQGNDGLGGQVLEQNGGKLVVLDETVLSPERELKVDLLNIIHVFSARMHGLKNYKKQIHQIVTNKTIE